MGHTDNCSNAKLFCEQLQDVTSHLLPKVGSGDGSTRRIVQTRFVHKAAILAANGYDAAMTNEAIRTDLQAHFSMPMVPA
jgi:hypothetical protein